MLSKESLDQLLKGTYTNCIINKYYSETTFKTSEWHDIFSTVLKIYNISDLELVGILKDFELTSESCYTPTMEILDMIIKSQLPNSPLWINPFEIEYNCNDLGHHKSEYMISYHFKLKKKEDQVSLVSSMWIYENHTKVKQFLSPENPDWIKLEEISKLFPLQYWL